MKYSVLGINSGLGVSLYPFHNNIIANIETRAIFHTQKNEQWQANFNKPLFKKFDLKFMGELRALKKTPINIIISSPDCGSGSIFRLSRAKKLGNHKKNKSLQEFFTGVNYYEPDFFLFENLNGLFKSFSEKEFKDQLPNYRLIIFDVSVSKFGNSQISRKRLVIVGIKKSLPKKLKRYFKLPEFTKKPLLCEQLYGDLKTNIIPITGLVREPINSVISIHGGKKLSLLQIQKEWQKRLKGKKRWAVEGGNYSTAPGVYRNLDNDYPATARKANRQYDGDGLTLTPRHLARVQGVPDEFELHIDESKLQFWINKARTCVTKTPPMEISEWFKKCIDKIYNSKKYKL